jgi:hypothetical protein
MSNIVLSKDAVKRLLSDVKNIMKNPLNDNGIYYIHDDEDLLKGYALIIGPEGPLILGAIIFSSSNIQRIIHTAHHRLFIIQMGRIFDSILICIRVERCVFLF